jgi:hypothetical protein
MDQETKDVLNDIKLSIHELETRVTNLEKDSHPPVIKEIELKCLSDSYEELDSRLEVIEVWFNGIKLITTNKEELQ